MVAGDEGFCGGVEEAKAGDRYLSAAVLFVSHVAAILDFVPAVT